jgi:RHS repeat-associated protein
VTTGLDYAVNRHYDPQQGRFTQVDPAGMGATSLVNPQSLNLYAYCTNDPINHTDPDGLGLISALKRAFKKVIRAFVHAVIAGVVAFVMSGFNIWAGIAVFATDFAGQLGIQNQGYWHNQRGTPPTFPVSGVTLSQIFQGTILARFFPSPQDLLRFVIPINGFAGSWNPTTTGLSDCVKKLLGGAFLEPGLLFPRPSDLSKVTIHVGVPDWAQKYAVISIGAITIGNDIYVSPEVISQFAGRSWEDLTLIAHELAHVEQYNLATGAAGGNRLLGKLTFGAAYLGGYLAGRLAGKTSRNAENDNLLEKAADARAAKIIERLKARGAQPCR